MDYRPSTMDYGLWTYTLLLFQKLFPHNAGRFMIAGMAPSGWHKNVQKLVFNAGGLCYIFRQCHNLAEISI